MDAAMSAEGTGESVRVLIVDDHPLVREALGLAAMKAAPAAEIVAAGSFEQAKAALAERSADLVLLDLDLGAGGSLAHLMDLHAAWPDAQIAIVSATESPDVMRRARELGACGYLAKSAPLDALAGAVGAMLRGESAFPEGLDTALENETAMDAVKRLASLTPTQRRVLEGLREGLLNKQIAYELDISEATVKAHMTAIFRKLGVLNRTQALLVARHLETDAAWGEAAE